MKACDTILENCMMWISDISVYRCRLNRIQLQLNKLKNKYALEGRYDTYISIAQGFHTCLKKIQLIEAKIIHTINKRLNELYIPKIETWSPIENEAELFDNMLLANKMIIELQRNIHNAFSTAENIPAGKDEHSSIIVNMPGTKKMKLPRRG